MTTDGITPAQARGTDVLPAQAPTARQQTDQERLGALLPAWSALCTLVLMAATWPLWFRPAGTTFPQIPLTSFALQWSQRVDYALSSALCIGLLVATVIGATHRRALSLVTPRCILLFCAALAFLLVVLDQQRLQPWLYQMILVALVFGLCKTQRAVQLARILVVSIYAYSALGKLDFEFLHTVGQDFVSVVLGWFAVDTDAFAESTLFKLTLALPLVELALAGLLALRWTRRAGGVLAVLFHFVLVLVFSPLGLGHSMSVILWNVQFAVQALLLFVLPAAKPISLPAGFHLGHKLAACVVGAAALLPIGERIGLWDHWLSWALYAPHSSRTEVFVASSAVARLPEPLRTLAAESNADPEVATLWLRIPLKAWCLESNLSPVYPQDRCGVAAAWQIRRYLDTDFEVKLRILGVASRWDGRRTSTEFQRPEEFARLDDQFWLNTRPRKAQAIWTKQTEEQQGTLN